MCIPTRTFLSFNNDKLWITGKLKQLRQAKADAYRSGDKILYNQARNRLTKEIRLAKNNYSEKLKKELSANDPASVWTGLRNITKYKTPLPQSVDNQQLVDDLNVFYCRFEKARLTLHTDLHSTHSPQQFYSATIEIVLCSSITVWFGSASKTDIRRLQRTVRSSERIIGAPLPSLQELYTSRVRKRDKKVTLVPSHPAHSL